MRTNTLLFISLIILSLPDCTVYKQSIDDYILWSAGRPALKEMTKVGVVCYGEEGLQSEVISLASALQTALISEGVRVVRISLQDIFTSAELKGLFPEGGFSSEENIARGLRKGGRLKGNREALQEILDINEVNVAIKRFGRWCEMEREIRERLDIKYILAVRMMEEFSYEASLIDLDTKEVSWSLCLYSSPTGWGRFFKPLNRKNGIHFSEAQDVSASPIKGLNARLFQLAEFIVEEITR